MPVKILEGDAMRILPTLPAESVHCCVTSPPYWGLRDYGVEGQFGLEATPDAYVEKMVAVFREVRRVLRDDGTLWLNLGDCYANDTKWGGTSSGKNYTSAAGGYQGQRVRRNKDCDLKPKDLVGIPWMTAFALRADGWYLRQEIIWHKPAPMPESVKDRCTKAHEQIFLLSKQQKYFFDADAIAEECAAASYDRWDQDIDNQAGSPQPGKTNGTMEAVGGPRRGMEPHDWQRMKDRQDGQVVRKVNGGACFGKQNHDSEGTGSQSRKFERPVYAKRNRRSVWTVAGANFKQAHFATFPPKLIDPCILAGCPIDGTVLDPFGGAGTTGLVADRLNRSAILIELNPEYAAMGRKRIQDDAGMFADVQ